MFTKKQVLDALQREIEQIEEIFNKRVERNETIKSNQIQEKKYALERLSSAVNMLQKFKGRPVDKKSVQDELKALAETIIQDVRYLQRNDVKGLQKPDGLIALEELRTSINRTDRDNYSITALKDLGLLKYMKAHRY